MRCSNRNKRKIYYALFDSTAAAEDEYGNETGETVVYTDPVPMLANVSAAKNVDTADVFGIDVNYDKVIMVAGRSCPIEETSVLWVDTDPSNNKPYDYVVARVSRSINSTAIAVRKVDVSHV